MTRLAKLALAALILWCLVSSPTLMPAVVAGPSCGAPVPLQLFGLALADRLRAAQPSWNVGIAGCYPTPLFSHAVIVAQAGESLDGAGLRPIPDARIPASLAPSKPQGFFSKVSRAFRSVVLGDDAIYPGLWTNLPQAEWPRVSAVAADAYLWGLVGNAANATPCDLETLFGAVLQTASSLASAAPSTTAALKEYQFLTAPGTAAPDREALMRTMREGLPEPRQCAKTRASFLQGDPSDGLGLASRYQTTAAMLIDRAADRELKQTDEDKKAADGLLRQARQCLVLALELPVDATCHAPNRGLWLNGYLPALHAAVTLAGVRR